MNTTIFDICS